MAEEEPLLSNPTTHEMAVHVREYSRFTQMMKWGAIVSFATGLIIIIFVL